MSSRMTSGGSLPAVFERGQAVVGFDDAIALVLEAAAHHGADDQGVVGDEHGRRWSQPPASARRVGDQNQSAAGVQRAGDERLGSGPSGGGPMSASSMRRNPVTASTSRPKVLSPAWMTRMWPRSPCSGEITVSGGSPGDHAGDVGIRIGQRDHPVDRAHRPGGLHGQAVLGLSCVKHTIVVTASPSLFGVEQATSSALA